MFQGKIKNSEKCVSVTTNVSFPIFKDLPQEVSGDIKRRGCGGYCMRGAALFGRHMKPSEPPFSKGPTCDVQTHA